MGEPVGVTFTTLRGSSAETWNITGTASPVTDTSYVWKFPEATVTAARAPTLASTSRSSPCPEATIDPAHTEVCPVSLPEVIRGT